MPGQASRSRGGWLYAAAKIIIPKARHKYGLPADPQFLPTPVEYLIGSRKPQLLRCALFRAGINANVPEIFFELAKSFPEVHFLAAGKSRTRMG